MRVPNTQPVWSRKSLKQSAKVNIKRNYFACFAVCFILVFIGGQYGGTTQFIASYDKANVADIRYTGDDKRQVVEHLIETGLSYEEISKKFNIGDADAVERWAHIYNEQGPEGLNSKEISMFNTGSENSNWNIVNNVVYTIAKTEANISAAFKNKSSDVQLHLADTFDSITQEHSSKFQVVNAVLETFSKKTTWQHIVSVASAIFSVLVTLFVSFVLIVGERRFFLENRTYRKTKINRVLYLYKDKQLKPIMTMFFKDLFLTLWAFTIVGLFIKPFEYMMIPFILAENPEIDRKHAFKLSKQMMKGNKWEAAKMSVSFWIWYVAAIVPAIAIMMIFLPDASYLQTSVIINTCFGIVSMFLLNPYRTATKTELYIMLRKQAINEKYEFYEDLNDKYLDLDLLEQQMNSGSDDDDSKTVSVDFENFDDVTECPADMQ